MMDVVLSFVKDRLRSLRRRKRLAWAKIGNGSLYKLLSDADFKLVDIGARGGAMPQLVVLAPFSHYFACEPNSDEAERLTSVMRELAPWREITVIPEAIASQEGQATLYVATQPGLSSLLRPNFKIIRRYYNNGGYDICREISVSTVTLDHAAEKYGFTDACFVKLDTQGTELDIVLSGAKLLRRATLGVYVEVEFHPFYCGQPLFSDIDACLRDYGFSLFDLQRTLLRRARHRDDIYSRRQVVWADALYLREPDEALTGSNDEIRLKASRLLGLALAFEQFDLALELATSSRAAALLSCVYGEGLLQDLESLMRARTRWAWKRARSRRLRPDPLKSTYKDRGKF